MQPFIRILFYLIVFVYSSSLFSQDTTQVSLLERKVVVKMSTGKEYKGTLISKDEKILIIATDDGEIHLVAGNVKSIKEDTYEGEFNFPSNNKTRYFIGSSGIPLGKGEGYYQNLMVTGNFFNYGITDNFSIGGGFEFISAAQGSPILFFTPRYAIKATKKDYLTLGVVVMRLFNDYSAYYTYLGYTHGTSEANITFGAGFGFSGEGRSSLTPVNFSAIKRISNNFALLTENYFFFNTNNLSQNIFLNMTGVRILGEKNSFDLGIVVYQEFNQYSSGVPLLPVVGYTRVF